jgi:hypothetical protein
VLVVYCIILYYIINTTIFKIATSLFRKKRVLRAQQQSLSYTWARALLLMLLLPLLRRIGSISISNDSWGKGGREEPAISMEELLRDA